MSVSIVIPTFNNLALTQGCLAALRATAPGAEIVVVDNASTDGTREWLASQPGLVAILNEENLGFARACNQGLDASSGELVLYLNNDTIPQPGWLEPLAAALEDPAVGIAGAKLLYEDGTIQHAGVAVRQLDGDPYPFHVHLCAPADAPYVSRSRDVQMVTGACLLARRDLARFDEAYVNGHEDLDLCLRAREAGFRIRYVPESVVVHLESRTKRLVGLENFHYRKGVDNEEARGRRRFLERWGSALEIDSLTVLFTMVGWEDEGGGTILPRQIAKALVRRGHRVVVLVAPPRVKPGAPTYHLETAVDDGVKLVYLWNRPAVFNDAEHPEREVDDPNVRAIAERLAADLKPDVVHLHSLLGFSTALPAALGAPSVYTSHNYWPVCPRMYLFRADLSLCDGPSDDGSKCGSCLGRTEKASLYAERLRAGRRMLGRDVDRHLAVSNRVRELFEAAGHDAARIHVLHQQPESADWIWAETGSRRELVTRLERPLRVGFIGSLYPHKGAHVLVQAVQGLDGVEAHLFGGGAPQYVEALRGLDPAGRVVFHGGYEPERLPELLARVDVVCVPSVWEDCAPLVVAEALAARAPVVGSRIGGIPDFVTAGETGFLFQPGDPAALAEALRSFLDEPELLGRMQAAIGAPPGFDSYLDELEGHYRAVIAARLRVEGARGFAVLVGSGELDVERLREYAAAFGPDDDATLVIHVADGDASALERAVASAGLEGDDSPDLLAVLGPAELRSKVDAVYEDGVSAAELRRRAEAIWAQAA
jgi:GT2 family glycosyltransferase/glycosyltransferase involved in cell wall biosynthesis